MTDPVKSFVGGLIVAIIALISLALFDGLASAESIRTPLGWEIIKSASDSIVLLVLIALPGGLLIVGLLKGILG